MNNEEKIFKYIDDQFSQEEKDAFEKELSISPELKKEYEVFLKIKNEFKSVKDLKTDENYSSTIIPRVRERLEKKKKLLVYKNLGYAFSVALLLFITFIIYNPLKNEGFNDIEEFTQSLSETEKYDVLDYINCGQGSTDDYTDLTAISAQFDMENIINTNAEKSELSSYYDLDIENLSRDISAEDLDQLYTKILNKEF